MSAFTTPTFTSTTTSIPVRIDNSVSGFALDSETFNEIFGNVKHSFAIINGKCITKIGGNSKTNGKGMFINSYFVNRHKIGKTVSLTKLDADKVIDVNCIYFKIINSIQRIMAKELIGKLIVEDDKIFALSLDSTTKVQLEATGNYFNDTFINNDDIKRFINDNKDKYFNILDFNNYEYTIKRVTEFRNSTHIIPKHMEIKYCSNKKEMYVSTETFNAVTNQFPIHPQSNRITATCHDPDNMVNVMLTKEEQKIYALVNPRNSSSTITINDNVSHNETTTIIIPSHYVNIISAEKYRSDKPTYRSSHSIHVHNYCLPLILIDDQGEIHTNISLENNEYKINNRPYTYSEKHIIKQIYEKYSGAKQINTNTYYNLSNCNLSNVIVPLSEIEEITQLMIDTKAKLNYGNIIISDNDNLDKLLSYIVSEHSNRNSSINDINKYGAHNPDFTLPYNKEYCDKPYLSVKFASSNPEMQEQIDNIHNTLHKYGIDTKTDCDDALILTLTFNKEYIKSYFNGKVILNKKLECDTEYLASSIIQNSKCDLDEIMTQIFKRAPITNNIIHLTNEMIDEITRTN